MLTENLSQELFNQGVLGIVVVLFSIAIVFLFKQNNANHLSAIEDRREMVEALVNSANSQSQVAATVEKTNELLRQMMVKAP